MFNICIHHCIVSTALLHQVKCSSKNIPMDDLGATVPYLIKSCNLQNTIFKKKNSDWSYRPAATNVR